MLERIPKIFVPQEQLDIIENSRIAQLDHNRILIGVVNGVIGEASVEIIIADIAIEQRRLEFAFDHDRLVAIRRYILVRIQNTAILQAHVLGLVLQLDRV